MPSYRNQLINLLCKSIDWFLYAPTLTFNELMHSAVSNHLSKLCTALVWKQKYCIPFHQMKKKKQQQKKKRRKTQPPCWQMKTFWCLWWKKISSTDLSSRFESKAHNFQKEFSSKKTAFCTQFVTSSLWRLWYFWKTFYSFSFTVFF